MNGIWEALGDNPSATVVLAFVVIMLASGLFFLPRWVANAMLRAKDAEIGRWRKAWELSEEARREERRQTEQMLDGLKLITAIVRSIRKAVSSPPDEGDDEE